MVRPAEQSGGWDAGVLAQQDWVLCCTYVCVVSGESQRCIIEDSHLEMALAMWCTLRLTALNLEGIDLKTFFACNSVHHTH